MLAQQCHMGVEIGLAHVADIDTADADRARFWIGETQQQMQQARFAHSAHPGNCDVLAGRNRKI